jgi:diaminopimelate decarboxylase
LHRNAVIVMSEFHYQNDELFVEQVALSDIAAQFGTPCYVYSRKAIVDAYREFASAQTSHRVTVCYAMKANSNLGVLDCLAREGAGFDIVSGGELKRVLAAGGDAKDVVFSGVGKSREEMREALQAGVRCFNVESEPEMQRLNEVAGELNQVAPVSVRVNPDVDAGTHPYISTGLRENKFGIAHDRAIAVYEAAKAMPNLNITGIDCHIGSQITEVAPYLAALDKLIELIEGLAAKGIELTHIDLGGGLGIPYEGEQVPPRASLIEAISQRLDQQLGDRSARYELMFEFGRSMVGTAGMLITRVEYLKPTEAKNFAVVDAAMNDLLRPSLYTAHHRVLLTTGPCNGILLGQSAKVATGWRATLTWPYNPTTCLPLPTPVPTAWSWHQTTTRAPGRQRLWLTAASFTWSASGRVLNS